MSSEIKSEIKFFGGPLDGALFNGKEDRLEAGKVYNFMAEIGFSRYEFDGQQLNYIGKY